jgi:hypothetical protein
MLPFKVTTVVACDDIRMEQNNKAILIGVYNGTMVVPGFPSDILLAWWIQIRAEELGKHELEVRVLKDGNSTLLRASIAIEINAPGWSTLPLPRAPIQLQGPGHLELEMRIKDGGKWDVISELDINEGPLGLPISPAPTA